MKSGWQVFGSLCLTAFVLPSLGIRLCLLSLIPRLTSFILRVPRASISLTSIGLSLALTGCSLVLARFSLGVDV